MNLKVHLRSSKNKTKHKKHRIRNKDSICTFLFILLKGGMLCLIKTNLYLDSCVYRIQRMQIHPFVPVLESHYTS